MIKIVVSSKTYNDWIKSLRFFDPFQWVCRINLCILISPLKLCQERLVSLQSLLSVSDDGVEYFMSSIEPCHDIWVQFNLRRVKFLLARVFLLHILLRQNLVKGCARIFQYLRKVVFKVFRCLVKLFKLLLSFCNLGWRNKIILVILLVANFLLKLFIEAIEIELDTLKHLMMLEEQVLEIIVIIYKVKGLLLLVG